MELNYDSIQSVAEDFAKKYRQENNVTPLPSTVETAKYREIIFGRFVKVVELIKEHFSARDLEGGHGFEHAEDIASRAGLLAEKECQIRQLPEDQCKDAVSKAILSGLLHDVEKSAGFEEHMIKGEETARSILKEAGIEDETVLLIVRHHDHENFNDGGDKILAVAFGAVFDVDHFRWGLDRADTFWRMKEKMGKTAPAVLTDYQYLIPFLDATYWRTQYGKIVGPKYIEFGLAIAKHVEKTFS